MGTSTDLRKLGNNFLVSFVTLIRKKKKKCKGNKYKKEKATEFKAFYNFLICLAISIYIYFVHSYLLVHKLNNTCDANRPISFNCK